MLLKVFRINLDPECASYRELGMAVLKEFVRALQDVARRHKGEPVNTPVLPDAFASSSSPSESLRAALEGWKKGRRRSKTVLHRGLRNSANLLKRQQQKSVDLTTH
jgi:hypothetical protein